MKDELGVERWAEQETWLDERETLVGHAVAEDRNVLNEDCHDCDPFDVGTAAEAVIFRLIGDA